MLNTKVYAQALNLAAENYKSAKAHLNDTEAARQLDLFRRIMDYARKFGLSLDTQDKYGSVGLCFRRSGIDPYATLITLDF